MAQEIQVKNSGKAKKTTIRMDMTPMVDLGFLLVTFFILTSVYATPKAMKLQMPQKNQNAKMPVFESGTITFFLAQDNLVFYQKGLAPKLYPTDFSQSGVAKLIADTQHQSKEKFFVIIKATSKAKYKNLIDVLDELEVRNITSFAIADFNAQDKALLDAQNVQ